MNNETLQKMRLVELFEFYQDETNDVVWRLRARALRMREDGQLVGMRLLQQAADEIEAARRYEASVNEAISECGGYQP